MSEEFNITGEEEKKLEDVGDIKHKQVYDKTVAKIEAKEVEKEAMADMGEEVPPEPSEEWDPDVFKEGFYALGIITKCERLKDIEIARCKKYAHYMTVVFPLAISSRIIAAFMLLVMVLSDLSPCIAAMTGKPVMIDGKKDQREPAASTKESDAFPEGTFMRLSDA